MAVRVTATEVKEIIETSLSGAAISPFITVANLTVNQHLADKGLDEALLKEIERWLAAHFVAIRDPVVKSSKLGDADDTFHGESAMWLDFTPYGQQVKILDPTGTLAANIGKRRAFMEVL